MTTIYPFLTPSQLEPEVNSRGQFRIRCPDGKARWYTRVTTYIKVLDDRSLLEQWKNRKVLIGLHADRSLIQELLNLDTDQLGDRDTMNKLVDRIFTAGDGYLAAERGTRLHHLAYLWDTSQDLPPDVTEIELETLMMYNQAITTYGIEHLPDPRHPGRILRECRVVIDHRKVTGTFDSAVRYKCLDGVTRNVCMDLKSKPGEYAYGRGEVAQQDSLYAEGVLYEDDGTDTGRRDPMPDISESVGLMLHVPQDASHEAKLYEVDLRLGRHLVDLSKSVRSARNYSKHVFTEVPLP